MSSTAADPRRYVPKLTHEQRSERRAAMRAEIANGTPVAEVAARYGVAYETAHKASWGRPRVRAVSIDTLVILAKLMAGASPSAIANEMGVSRQAVHQVRERAKAAGIKFSNRK